MKGWRGCNGESDLRRGSAWMASQDPKKPGTAQRKEGPAKAEGTREVSCGKENLSGH